MTRMIMAVGLLVLLAGLGGYQLLLAGSPAQSQTPPRPAPPIPVRVAEAAREAVPLRLEVIGNVQAIASVAFKSRIDGQITEVKVRDGQYVKAGDVLFELDARAALAQVHQAQGQLARDRAQLAFAQHEVKRFAPLAEKSFVSKEQLDQAQANAAAFEAAVQADQAALENLQVQLSYYTITAPIDGRLGVVTLKAGNNVKANSDLPFLILNQVKPIYVLFSVSERELPAIRAAQARGPLAVSVRAGGDSGPTIVGELAFFDNAVDATTGTIALRAVFANGDERLWPGQFANVTLTLGVEADAVTVPQAAVQIGQANPYVFVAKPDNTAELRRVEVSRTVDGKSIVAKGLAAGERVVIDGQLRLSNGSRIEVRQAPDAPASGKSS